MVDVNQIVWFVLVLAVSLTAFAIWKPNYILAVISAASWLLILWYTRANPFATIPVGSDGDTIIVLVCLGLAMGILLYTVQRIRSEKEHGNAWNVDIGVSRGENGGESVVDDEQSRRYGTKSNGNHYETATEYQARIYAVLNPPRKRR